MIIATFANYLNIGKYGLILPAVMIIAFGISVAGLIFGISELKKSKNKRVMIGISGHIAVLLLFLYIIYLTFTMTPTH
jgi:Ca2+/H+ antiporter